VLSGAAVGDTLAGFLQLATGAHTENPEAHKFWKTEKVVSVEFEFDGPGVFNIDGEIVEHDGKLKLTLKPRDLEVCVSEEELDWVCPASEVMEEYAERGPSWKAAPERWRMLWIFGLGCIVNQAIWIGFSPVQTEMMARCDVSSTWVNFLSLSFMVLYIPASFPASYVTDVFGGRSALLCGVVLNLVGAIVRAVLPLGPGVNSWTLMVGQVICALSQPFFTNMPPKLAMVWFPGYQRAIADSIASMCIILGSGVGFIMPTALGLQTMVYVQVGWSAFAVVFTVLLFKDHPDLPSNPAEQAHHQHGGHFLAELKDALTNWRLICIVVLFSCVVGGFNTIATLSEELTQPYGFTSDQASNFGVFTLVFGVLGAAVFATLVGYTQKYKYCLLVCTIISLVSLLGASYSVVYLGPKGIAGVNAGLAGLGFGAIPIIPLGFEAAVEVAYPTGEATLSGLLMGGAQIIGIVLVLLCDAFKNSGVDWAPWVTMPVVVFVGVLATVVFNDKNRRLDAQEAALEETDLKHSGMGSEIQPHPPLQLA